MLRFGYNRAFDVLYVGFCCRLTSSSLAAFDVHLKDFVSANGAVHVLLDFTVAPLGKVESDLIVERGRHQATLVPGRKRVFVASRDHLYGILRMYAAYQEPPPEIVRTMPEAFRVLGLRADAFACVNVVELPSSLPLPRPTPSDQPVRR